MAELNLGEWPVEELVTERLALRESRAVDREGLVALHSSAEVYRYLGGAMSRERAEEAVRPPYGVRPGGFVVREAASGEFVGAVSLKRHDREGAFAGAPDVGYLLLAEYWGKAYAQEAVGAVLRWLAGVVPDEKVVAVTQSANEASLRLLKRLGFVEVEHFEEFDAEQVLCAAALPR